jgi:hypothetical protein
MWSSARYSDMHLVGDTCSEIRVARPESGLRRPAQQGDVGGGKEHVRLFRCLLTRHYAAKYSLLAFRWATYLGRQRYAGPVVR